MCTAIECVAFATRCAERLRLSVNELFENMFEAAPRTITEAQPQAYQGAHRKGRAFPHIRRRSRASLIRIRTAAPSSAALISLTRTRALVSALTSASTLLLNFRARHQPQLAVRYNLLARFQAIFDDGHGVDRRSGFDGSHFHGRIRLDHVDE